MLFRNIRHVTEGVIEGKITDGLKMKTRLLDDVHRVQDECGEGVGSG